MDNQRLVEMLGLLNRKIHRSLLPVFEAEGVSFTESVVLWKMKRLKVCHATKLADDIGIPPSTLTGVLDRLVAKGCLNRVPDPNDRRAVLLEADEHLFELLARVKKEGEVFLAGMFKSVPDDQMRQLIESLERVISHLELEEGESA
ncbi:MAG TPA: MarR family transcriptional regulator [Spirochaetia bacterium]|nr:MarR family transcriptional regulator [Spirochaetia bacterium]